MKIMKTITFDVKGHIGTLTLNRPEALNAINPDVYAEIKEVMQETANNPEVRVVIITGSGEKAFCAGADITAMRTMTPYEIRGFAGKGVEAFKSINHSPKPVIAAVNGLALGGGCEIALSSDIIIASAKAKFGMPEISIGVFPGGGATQRLTRLVGIHRAKELIFTGKIIKAEEALSIGMINQVVTPCDFKDEVTKLAESICEKGPIALHMAKVAINQAMESSLSSGLDYELECFSSLFATQDQKEGMAAFIERRPPQFKGL